MKEPFAWYHNLYYGEKRSLRDFDTKNPKSLDCLLKKLFMKAKRTGKLKMKNSLPAFNAAYYVAVCLANTEGIDEANLDDEIDAAINTIWMEDYVKHQHRASIDRCPYVERMLIKWMIYAILRLQRDHNEEIDEFLETYREKLDSITDDEDLVNSEEWDDYSFLLELPAMIEQWEYRYCTDLRPHAEHPCHYDAAIWDNNVRFYSMDDLECQLTFFRSKEEQIAFLDWAKKESGRPQPYNFGDDFPF